MSLMDDTQSVETLKKKIQILKKAVMDLREQKHRDDAKISDLQAECDRVKLDKHHSAETSTSDIDNKHLVDEVQKLQTKHNYLQEKFNYQSIQLAELSEQNYALLQELARQRPTTVVPSQTQQSNDKRCFHRVFEAQQDKLQCLIILRYNVMNVAVVQVEFPDLTYNILVSSINDFAPKANGKEIQFIYNVDRIKTQQSFEINQQEKLEICKAIKNFIRDNQVARPGISAERLAPLFKL